MKKIFISYSSSEEEFAERLKNIFEITFCCEVFTFKENLKFGDEWFGVIRGNLEKADLHIIILSPISVMKPWTYFEAGGSWIKKKAKPIPMTLGLAKNEISESNPLSKLWIGDFFDEKDIKKLFTEIREREVALKYNKGEDMEKINDKFVKDITFALGDKYKIIEGFRKIMKKNAGKLHKQGVAPMPAILYEAFGKDYFKKNIGLDINEEHKIYISSYDPAKLGEMIRYFDGLSRQGVIKRIDTPLESFLKKTIKKAEERVNFPSEIAEELIKNEKVLKGIDFNDKSLAGLKKYPMIDEDDLIVFLQTEEVVEKILGKGPSTTAPSPERMWCNIINFTKEEWWGEYKDYFFNSDQSKLKVFNLDCNSQKGLIMGSFHKLLWDIPYNYKDLRNFLRSWYRISV